MKRLGRMAAAFFIVEQVSIDAAVNDRDVKNGD